VQNSLYRNRKDGTFTDATEEAGLNVIFNTGLIPGGCPGGSNGGLAAGDFNDDGWPDLYVGVWNDRNRLFLNDGRGSFRDATTEQIADPGWAHGVAVGDINNDGHLDIFQAAGAGMQGLFRSLLLLNLGEGQFLDVTEAVEVFGTFGVSAVGHGLADIDNDGDLDLLIGRPLLLYLNTGQNPPEFVDRTAQSGMADVGDPSGFPVAFGDDDGDGFLDLVFGGATSTKSWILYRNNGNGNHSLRVELVGTTSNRSGIGARLIATSGDLWQIREILGGLGFQQDELVTHFGLGERTTVDRLEIRWPSGQVDVLTDLPVDQKIRVIEGQGGYQIVPPLTLISPTTWEYTLPDTLVVGWTLPFQATVRPARFREGTTLTQVIADVHEMGGPAAVPLQALGDGTYRLNIPVTVKGPPGVRFISITIGHVTPRGLVWTNVVKTVTVIPATDLVIFGDALADGWTVKPGPGVTVTPATTVVAERMTALALQTTGRWRVDVRPAVPVDTLGYTTLRLAFHPGDVPVVFTNALSVEVNGQTIGIVRRNPGDIGVDFAEKIWQVVEIPLEKFGLEGPIETLRFTGNFKGTWYLDDLRLVAVPSPPMPPPITAVEEDIAGSRPTRFALEQNVPNPFNGETVIRFTIPERSGSGDGGRAGTVELAIYNLAGQKVVTLVEGVYRAGMYTVRWDGRDRAGRALPSGIYVARLRAGEQMAMRKLVLVR
jgi:hypothetical protein